MVPGRTDIASFEVLDRQTIPLTECTGRLTLTENGNVVENCTLTVVSKVSLEAGGVLSML
jgi:hypothetical protein